MNFLYLGLLPLDYGSTQNTSTETLFYVYLQYLVLYKVEKLKLLLRSKCYLCPHWGDFALHHVKGTRNVHYSNKDTSKKSVFSSKLKSFVRFFIPK